MAENIVCNFCGQPAKFISIDPIFCLCHRCFSLLNTCNACVNGATCDFETNPSPLPKRIQKTIRQGNMTMQTVAKNEERIRETCQKNCACFSEEFGCLKENGICANYKEVVPLC